MPLVIWHLYQSAGLSPSYSPGKTAADGPSTWASAKHVEDQDRVSDFWLQLGSALTVVDTRKNEPIREFSYSCAPTTPNPYTHNSFKSINKHFLKPFQPYHYNNL